MCIGMGGGGRQFWIDKDHPQVNAIPTYVTEPDTDRSSVGRGPQALSDENSQENGRSASEYASL